MSPHIARAWATSVLSLLAASALVVTSVAAAQTPITAKWSSHHTGTTQALAQSPAAAVVTASITVSLDVTTTVTSGAKVFSVANVAVGAGPELTSANVSSNPKNYCGTVEVDIDLDAGTITVDGGADPCDFKSAELNITLAGAEFAGVSVLNEGLFVADLEEEFVGLGLKGSSPSGMSRSIMTAVLPQATVQSITVNGASFLGVWEGIYATDMLGSTTFAFTLASAQAAPATPVVAAPVFTG